MKCEFERSRLLEVILTQPIPELAPQLRGVFALLLTPFTDAGAIDWEIFTRYVDWQISQQPAGLFAVCGTSEMKWLTFAERLELAHRAVARAGKMPVIATANLDPDPGKHRDEIRQMEDTGVAGIVLVPPSGMARDRNAFHDYLLSHIQAAGCPVILYEWPQVEDYFISPDLFGELVAAGGLAGIKDTTCTREGIAAKQQVAGNAVVFQANTAFLLDALELGVQGITAITSAACCDLVVRFWSAFRAQLPETRALHRELVFLDALLKQGHPATAKYLVSLQGIPMSTRTRWPQQLSDELRKALTVWQQESNFGRQP